MGANDDAGKGAALTPMTPLLNPRLWSEDADARAGKGVDLTPMTPLLSPRLWSEDADARALSVRVPNVAVIRSRGEHTRDVNIHL